MGLCRAETIPSSLPEMAWLQLRARATRWRKTNPILPVGRGPGERKCAKRTQFGLGMQVPVGPNMRNEPSLGQPGWDGAWDRGPFVRNEAKLGMAGVCGQRQSLCVGQLRQTVERAKRTQFRGADRPGGSWNKQTQFAAGRILHHSTLPSFQYSNPRPIMQNEPNSRRGRAGPSLGDEGRLCKTNPISGSRPARGIPSIPLFYYSTIPVRCRLCKTKPISPDRSPGRTVAEFLLPWTARDIIILSVRM